MSQEQTSLKRGKTRGLPAPLVLLVVAAALTFAATSGPRPVAGSGPRSTSQTSHSKKKPPRKPSKKPPAKPPTTHPPTTPASSQFVVLGFNDLGMHCMNQDFSELCLLPPFNNLHAQVIDRSGEDPRIVTGGVQVTYSIPGNTNSATKTNFWNYVLPLFGAQIPPNVGLAGKGLTGTLDPTGDGDFAAVGIPLTPLTDNNVENPFQLGSIAVTSGRRTLATTQTVVPVSWEINCNLCHNTPGQSVATSILAAHDKLHNTNLQAQKPVLCASCHADPALKANGVAGVSTLSHAMHGAHAKRFTPDVLQKVNGNSCYACHPGIVTQCQRDIHRAKGITCTNCHGDLAAVGDPTRTPWVSEPRCDNCHNTPGFAYEQPGKLYKESKGHHGVKCASCHGSPHAITPTITAADNVQAIRVQGHAGTIDKCTVCHKKQPGEAFDHTFDGGGD